MELDLKLLKHQRALYESKKDIAGLVCGRGSGKTVILSWLIVFAMLKGQRVLAFSQTYKSLSQNLFDEVIKRFEELKQKPIFNKQAMTITLGKGMVAGYSYENIESCRGLTEIQLLVLDEMFLAPATIFSVTAPCLRGNFTPQIRFGTSPRKGSVWNHWCLDNMKTGKIDVFQAKMSDNSFISKESLELSMNAIQDETLKRQEIYGEILLDDDDSCIIAESDFPTQLVDDSADKPIIVGIDGSGQGRDKSVICIRKGNRIIDISKHDKLDPFDASSIIKHKLLAKGFNTSDIYEINIDMGYGEGLYAVLSREYGNVNLVPFAGKADNVSYSNKRSEMYFNLAKAIRNGLYIEDPDIIEELINTRFLLDKSDRYLLVPKEEIKLVINRSPDSSDALALTFVNEQDSRYRKMNPREKRAYAHKVMGNLDD